MCVFVCAPVPLCVHVCAYVFLRVSPCVYVCVCLCDRKALGKISGPKPTAGGLSLPACPGACAAPFLGASRDTRLSDTRRASAPEPTAQARPGERLVCVCVCVCTHRAKAGAGHRPSCSDPVVLRLLRVVWWCAVACGGV